jgi:hypothetical protein
MGLNFTGQYTALNLAEFRRMRRICGSVLVAVCPKMKRAAKARRPPKNDPMRLNVAAPMTAAQKKQLAFDTQDGERPVQRFVNSVDAHETFLLDDRGAAIAAALKRRRRATT